MCILCLYSKSCLRIIYNKNDFNSDMHKNEVLLLNFIRKIDADAY